MNYYSAYRIMTERGLTELEDSSFSNYVCPSCKEKLFYKDYPDLKPIMDKDVLIGIKCPKCGKAII